MSNVHKVTIQVRAPKGTFPGEVAEGFFVVADEAVVLTDQDGKPIGEIKHHLSPGQDARLLACRLVRERRRSSAIVRGFNEKLQYSKLK